MSKGTFERQSQFELKYKKGPMNKSSLFGEHYIYYSEENNQKIICIEKIFNDRSSLNRATEEIKKKILNKHDYLLNLLDYSIEVQKNWCATFYILRAFYEFPEKSLKKIIVEWKEDSKPSQNFNNEDDPVHNAKSEELTHLLYHQVSANAHLQEIEAYHGDICPSNIFRSNKGDFKLVFRANQNVSPERYQIEKMQKNEPIYVSPILYQHFKRNQFQSIQHDKAKSEAFSLGLTILEAALEKSVQNVYGPMEVDKEQLNRHLSELESSYDDNPLLYSSVQKMLEIEEEERADFQSLKGAMPDYKEICDFFYKMKHNLLEEEDGQGSFNDFSQEENQGFQFAPNQNYEVPENFIRNNENVTSNDYVDDSNIPAYSPQENDDELDYRENLGNQKQNKNLQENQNNFGKQQQGIQVKSNLPLNQPEKNLNQEFTNFNQTPQQNVYQNYSPNIQQNPALIQPQPIQPQIQTQISQPQINKQPDNFFNFFDEPVGNNPVFAQPIKIYSQTQPIQQNQYTQPQTYNLQSEPYKQIDLPQSTQNKQFSESLTTPTNLYQQNLQTPTNLYQQSYPYQQPTQINNYQQNSRNNFQTSIPQPKQIQPTVYQQSYQPQNQSISSYQSQQEEIKMINGVAHKMVEQEEREISPEGYQIIKKVKKYVPVSNSYSIQKDQTFSTNSTQNNSYFTSSYEQPKTYQYQGINKGYQLFQFNNNGIN